MKYISNERGALPVLMVILVVVVIVAAGAAFYNVSKSHNKDTQTANVSASPSPNNSPASTASPITTPTPTPAPTDKELITSAVKAEVAGRGITPAKGSQLLLRNLQGNFVWVDVSIPIGGYADVLKKSQGQWTVVYSGQNLDPTMEARLGTPQGFFSNPGQQSGVLYTY
jgi:hypothetical protein